MPEKETSPAESVLTLDSDVAELQRLEEFLDEFCERAGVSEEICYQLQVALEELVINAIKHGECEPKENAIRLAIKREGDEVSAVLSDSGVSFNPLNAPPPDLTKCLLDRPVGGLGIHLVRHLIPSIRYERNGNRNYLYLAKPVQQDPNKVPPQEKTYANGDGNNQS